MDDLFEELDIEIIKGKSIVTVKKYSLDLPDSLDVQSTFIILGPSYLEETWTLIIEDNIITSIIRDSKEYTLCDKSKKDRFIYKNGDFSISLRIERTTFDDYSGYFFNCNSDPVVKHFYYRFLC
jgi:hypothetical protein